MQPSVQKIETVMVVYCGCVPEIARMNNPVQF
jgi:hypothetical protein